MKKKSLTCHSAAPKQNVSPIFTPMCECATLRQQCIQINTTTTEKKTKLHDITDSHVIPRNRIKEKQQ